MRSCAVEAEPAAIFPFRHGGGTRPLVDELAARRPEGDWKRLIEDGHVLVFGRFVGIGYMVKEGDLVEWQAEVVEPPVCAELPTLYVDEHVLVIDKPARIPVHPTGAYRKNCVVEVLRERFGRLHPIHRLDRETSGTLVLGRTPEAATALHKGFHLARKSYLVAVHGSFPERLRVELPLGSKLGSQIRIRVGYREDGQASRTDFRRLASKANASLVLALPRSGRKHQIRAHLAESGFPVAGDPIYGMDETRFLRFLDGTQGAEDGVDRVFLHCARLVFTHPVTDVKIHVRSPLPAELRAAWDRL